MKTDQIVWQSPNVIMDVVIVVGTAWGALRFYPTKRVLPCDLILLAHR